MRCFYHPGVEAVGSCKECCKGLCAACAVDLGHGLACKNAHEADVEALNQRFVRGSRVETVKAKWKYVAPTFYIFSGFVFSAFGLIRRGVDLFALILGGASLVFGVVLFFLIDRGP